MNCLFKRGFLILFFTLFSESQSIANFCPSAQDQCVPLTESQRLTADMCQAEMKTAGCDEFIKSHPDLVRENKMRDCDKSASCPPPFKILDYTKACLTNWGGAWKDLAMGPFQFLTGEIKMSPEIAEREKFFRECTTAACKREMLGSFADLFENEEIEGHVKDKNLDPKDPANQNYLQGLSAKVLYNKLQERLREKMKNGTLEQPLIEPWSNKPMKIRLTAEEKINQALQKMGVQKTACYDPTILAEMRCYALFSILDPLMFAGAALKVARLSGRGLEKAALKGAELERAELAENAVILGKKQSKVAALKAHSNSDTNHKIENYINDNGSDYVKAANENSDLATENWKSAGIKIDKTGKITVNTAEAGQKVADRVDGMIKSGQIKESDALLPVFLYKKDGKVIGVSPNELPPAGAVRAAEAVLSNDDFFQLLADGKFPMGGDKTVTPGRYPKREVVFLHDMNHYAGFLRTPEFMAATRKAAKDILATKAPTIRRKLQERFFVAAEFSNVMPKETLAVAKKELENLKTKMGLPKSKFLPKSAYVTALKKMDAKQLGEIFTEIKASEFSNAKPEPVGGGEFMLEHRYLNAKDVDINWQYSEYDKTQRDPHFHSESSWELERLNEKQKSFREIMMGPSAAKEVDPKVHPFEVVIEKMANHLEKSDAFMRIRPQDWMNDGMRSEKLAPTGNTTRFCKSAAINRYGAFYKMYCSNTLSGYDGF
jgi:hypothetical protein